MGIPLVNGDNAQVNLSRSSSSNSQPASQVTAEERQRRTISLSELFSNRQSRLIQVLPPKEKTVPRDEHPLKFITEQYLKEMQPTEPQPQVDQQSADDTLEIIARLNEWQTRLVHPSGDSINSLFSQVSRNREDESATTRRTGNRNYFDMFLRAYNDVIADWNTTQPANNRPPADTTTSRRENNGFHVRIPSWVSDSDREYIVRTVNTVAAQIDSTVRTHQRNRQEQGLNPHDEQSLMDLPLEDRAIELFHTNASTLSSASLVTYVENMIRNMARAFRRHSLEISPQQLSTNTSNRLTIYIIHERSASSQPSVATRRMLMTSRNAQQPTENSSTAYLAWRSRLNRLQQRLEAAQDTFNSSRYRLEPSASRPETQEQPTTTTTDDREAGRSVRRRLILEDDLE